MIVEPPDRLPTLAELGRIFVVGIGGSAMSAVARIAFERGAPVAGSDVRESAVIEALRGLGILLVLRLAGFVLQQIQLRDLRKSRRSQQHDRGRKA